MPKSSLPLPPLPVSTKPYGGVFDLDVIERRLHEIEKQLAQPNAWDTPEALTPALQEKTVLERQLETFNALKKAKSDAEEWIMLAEEEAEPETLANANSAVALLAEKLNQVEMDMLLSDKEDSTNAIIDIHPGAGGTEAQDWAEMLLRMYVRFADKHDFKVEYLNYIGGDEAGIKSVTIRVVGTNAYGLLKVERGIHRLIRISPFDTSGRRHTSFASVDVIPDAGQEITITIDEKDLRIDVFRASGAGGQHVNKTNSAIRITHLPTNIVVQCQNEKSQHSNKDSAMHILRARLYEQELRKVADQKKSQYLDKDAINFGSQIRTYTMQPYRLVKDHRSGTEVTDVDAVLDGGLDKLVHDLLLYFHASKNTPS